MATFNVLITSIEWEQDSPGTEHAYWQHSDGYEEREADEIWVSVEAETTALAIEQVETTHVVNYSELSGRYARAIDWHCTS